ncbi:hypothetical protein H1P_220023 [Hyella patelloides LEGE 07179]|uniref:Uncharacterized protein n=1 Tax=Hyella patelloides LEGE 07179 TaxID=945734 RepID=A0A563VQN6_9CYAN|nr:hypothetical protein H1P_220023 [Hyella patelloides LEGE 07179]
MVINSYFIPYSYKNLSIPHAQKTRDCHLNLVQVNDNVPQPLIYRVSTRFNSFTNK